MSAYSALILSEVGLQAYYRMDETSGTVAHDSTSHAYNAALSGSFTLGQPGAIVGDSDTSILFDGATGIISLPYTLNYTTFSTLSLEFWTNVAGTWQYIVITCDGSNIFTYLNSLPYSASATSTVVVGDLIDFAGSYVTSNLDEIALYNTQLSLPQILNHYATAGYSPSSLTFPAVNRRTGLFSATNRRDGVIPATKRR